MVSNEAEVETEAQIMEDFMWHTKEKVLWAFKVENYVIQYACKEMIIGMIMNFVCE